MKNKTASLLQSVCIAAFLAASQLAGAAEKPAKVPVINSSDAKALAAKIGKTVSVEGLVQSVGKGDNDGVRFLNLSSKQGTGFVAAVFPPAYKGIGPVKNFVGKNIRVTGTLEKYKKQTQIKVLKASQVKALALPAEQKPKKKN